MKFYVFSITQMAVTAALLLAGCDDDDASAPASGSRLEVVSVDGFPHEVDVYATAGAETAVVFLHGGGSSNEAVAYDLRLTERDDPPSTDSVEWDLLETHGLMMVLPQGQAAQSDGTPTWSNHAMTSGQDDVAFLQALSELIASRYGISRIYLAGHSMGGVMTHRVWCESAGSFDGYLAAAGPASLTIEDCMPDVVPPFLSLVPADDNVIVGAPYEPVWTLNQHLAHDPAVLEDDFQGEFDALAHRAMALCDASVLWSEPPIEYDLIEEWRPCDGQLQLRYVYNAEHAIDSLQDYAEMLIVDQIAAFIDETQPTSPSD